MWKVIAACVLVLANIAHHALAIDREPPRVPLAISGIELQRYAGLLNLSDDQRHAIELEYEKYLDAFEPLRAEMIELAVRTPRYTQPGDELITSLPALVARARALDEGWFQSIEPLLIDTQRSALERVRTIRRRTMLMNLDVLGRLFGDSIPDLRERLESLNPPAETLAALEPALADYESKLAAGIEQLFTRMITVCNDDDNDTKAVEAVVELVRSLRAMNRNLVRDLSPSLPEEMRIAWHHELLLYAYGSAKQNIPMWTIARCKALLATELTDEQRQVVLELRDRAETLQNDGLERSLRLMDEEAIRVAPEQGAVQSPGYSEAMNVIRQELGAEDAAMSKTLQSLLGQERLQQLQFPTWDGRRGQGGLSSHCRLVVSSYRIVVDDPSQYVMSWQADGLAPYPMSKKDFDALMAGLGIAPGSHEQSASVFTAYERRLTETLMPLRHDAALNSLNVSIPRQDVTDPLARANAGQADRERMRAVIREADQALIGELRTLVPGDAASLRFDHLARWRERSLTVMNTAWVTHEEPNHAAEVDLALLLLQLPLDQDSWIAIDAALTAYETEAPSRHAARYEAYAKFMYDELARRDGWKGDGEYNHQVWSQHSEALHTMHRSLAEFNQDVAVKLAAALPAETGAALLEAYQRVAYPRAFEDRAAMREALGRALALEDATPAQREKIIELTAAYNAAYEEVREQVIALSAACWPDMPMIGKSMTPERTERDERFRMEFARAADQRAEINRTVLRGLRMTLSPNQLRRVQVPEVN